MPRSKVNRGFVYVTNYSQKFKDIRVVLLRHGETVYNVERRLQSSKDALNEKGKKQINDLKETLSKFKFSRIISSDETRAIESAQIIAPWYGLEFEITPLIKEKGSGIFSDKLSKEVDWSIVTGSFMDKKIPQGESIRDVQTRAKEFLEILNNLKPEENLLVVSHGTFLRILFCVIFNKDFEDYMLNYEFPNASYICLSKSNDGKWNLESSSLINKGESKNAS